MFQLSLNVSPEFAGDNFKDCFVLHNFVRERERDGYKFEEVSTVPGLEDVPDGQPVRGGLTANRKKVAGYILTDAGAVPWKK